jgi:hypothetical protein
VAALHIIRINNQLGFGIHPGRIRQQQIIIRLVSLRFLGIRLHPDTSGKISQRRIIQYPFKMLIAGAMRSNMVNV